MIKVGNYLCLYRNTIDIYQELEKGILFKINGEGWLSRLETFIFKIENNGVGVRNLDGVWLGWVFRD